MEINGRKNVAGTLLRLARLEKEMGQKEVCYGICVVSHLSKIERGLVQPDEKLVTQLFARLGIVYETNSDFLCNYEEKLKQYFYRLQYGLKTKEIWNELEKQESRLKYSPLALDYLLVKGLECGGSIELLAKLTDNMDSRQSAYFSLIKSEQEPDAQKSLVLCQYAAERLNNTLGLRYLMYGYYRASDYNAIHRMENQFVAQALEEGNTYALADYYNMNGSAYACVDMEEMMLMYYERVRHLLQNTGWWEQMESVLNYNTGCTYLSLGKYELAEMYLTMVKEEYFLLWHKLAWLKLRQKKKKEAEPYFEKMKTWINAGEGVLEADRLMYEELCMECEAGFLADPKYLIVLEHLLDVVKKERPFGFLYQYKEVTIEAYTKQRKYKKALDFQKEISLHI